VMTNAKTLVSVMKRFIRSLLSALTSSAARPSAWSRAIVGPVVDLWSTSPKHGLLGRSRAIQRREASHPSAPVATTRDAFGRIDPRLARHPRMVES
jgi:hypothetical protein